MIQPGKDLGHIDRHSKKAETSEESTEKKTTNEKIPAEQKLDGEACPDIN